MFVILFAANYYAGAQSFSTLMGARANGMAYASACLEDEWALFNNPGGLAKIKDITASFTYDARPYYSSFNRLSALFAMPVKVGVAGVGVYRYGDDLYNEQILSVGFSNSFGLASLGLKINYIQYSAEGFGTANAFTVSFGGIASLTPNLLVGAHIVNINQPKLSALSGETLPTILILGLGFKPSEKLFITTEIEKDLQYELVWKTGIEYSLNKKFVARTGFNLHPQVGFFGIGLKPKKFILDYALQYNLNLGLSHQATITYKFKSK